MSICTTCFVTQQTIPTETPVRVIAVKQHFGHFPRTVSHQGEEFKAPLLGYGTHDPDTFWAPMGEFLEGTYDDYGRVTLKHTPTNVRPLRGLLAELYHQGATVTGGKEAVGSVDPFDFKAFVAEKAPGLLALLTDRDAPRPALDDAAHWAELHACWVYVQEAGEDQRLFVVDPYRVVYPVRVAVMHEPAWTRLIEYSTSVGYRVGNVPREGDLPPREYVRLMVARVKERIDKVGRDDADICASVFGSQIMESLSELPGMLSGTINYETKWKLGRELYKGTVTEDQFFEQAKHWVDALYVLNALRELRIKFSPLVNSGEDYKNSNGSRYAALVQAVAGDVRELIKAKYRLDDVDFD